MFNNGFENGLKIEMDAAFDDDDSLPDATDDFLDEPKNSKSKIMLRRNKTKVIPPRKKKAKVMHQCDQCDAKYSSSSKFKHILKSYILYCRVQVYTHTSGF